MSTDRARLEAIPGRYRLDDIKQRLRWFGYGGHASDIAFLVEWLEKGLEIIKESEPIYTDSNRAWKRQNFLSRFEETP